MYREQSDVIRIFFSDQVRFEEFFYLRVFKFCLEKTSNTLVSVTEVKSIYQIVARSTNRRAKLFLFYALVLLT